MRTLITGVAGFVGSHLADRLLADSHEVHGIDDLSTGRKENVPDGVEFVVADISDSIHLGPYTTGYDLIVHCAASYADRDKWHRDTHTNVIGGINVGIAARACSARVVYFQTALVYGNNPYLQDWRAKGGDAEGNYEVVAIPLPTWRRPDPESSYAISKYAAEQYLRLSGVPLLTLRLANIYGPRNLSGPVPAFYKNITEGRDCTVSDTRRDFVYIDDLVGLVAQAIEMEATGTYHVSTGRDVSIHEVYSAVCDSLDRQDLGLVPITPRGDDDAPTILLDPSETIRDFSWVATTDLDEGVQAAVDWYKAHGVEQTYSHLEART